MPESDDSHEPDDSTKADHAKAPSRPPVPDDEAGLLPRQKQARRLHEKTWKEFFASLALQILIVLLITVVALVVLTLLGK